MSHEFEFYHGVALCRIIHNCPSAAIRLFSPRSNSSYVVNGDTGIFIKYSTRRMSPWQFTFTGRHCDEISMMMRDLPRTFIVLVCRDNGIICLDAAETKQLLGGVSLTSCSIHASRKPREKYRVSGGPEGKITYKVADNQFPSRIYRR